MSQVERKYMKQVDELILTASTKVLKDLQDLDLQTQKEGISFYDVLANSVHSPTKKKKAFSPQHRYQKRS